MRWVWTQNKCCQSNDKEIRWGTFYINNRNGRKMRRTHQSPLKRVNLTVTKLWILFDPLFTFKCEQHLQNTQWHYLLFDFQRYIRTHLLITISGKFSNLFQTRVNIKFFKKKYEWYKAEVGNFSLEKT